MKKEVTTILTRENELMLQQMDEINSFNLMKSEIYKSLELYLMQNDYDVKLTTDTGSDNLTIGYKLILNDLQSINGQTMFILENKPEEIYFIVKPGAIVSGKVVRLYHTLLGYVLQAKRKPTFNLDMLKTALNEAIR